MSGTRRRHRPLQPSMYTSPPDAAATRRHQTLRAAARDTSLDAPLGMLFEHAELKADRACGGREHSLWKTFTMVWNIHLEHFPEASLPPGGRRGAHRAAREVTSCIGSRRRRASPLSHEAAGGRGSRLTHRGSLRGGPSWPRTLCILRPRYHPYIDACMSQGDILRLATVSPYIDACMAPHTQLRWGCH